MSEPQTNSGSPGAHAPIRRGVSGALVAVLVIAVAAVAGGVAWWLQDARVQAREHARAEAVAQLEKTTERLKASEASAAAAVAKLKDAQVTVDNATKQANEATAQLASAQRDAAGARAERDQAKAAAASAKADIDRMRTNDLDPGLLPAAELPKVFGGLKQVRAACTLQMNGSRAALEAQELEAGLVSALTQSGLPVGGQSPFQIRLFVTVGSEQPNHSIGLLMLAMRTVKVPGEAASREVAVWGQQRTAQADEERIAAQIQLMVQDLGRELGAALGVKAPPASAPKAAEASGSATPPQAPAEADASKRNAGNP